MNVNGFMGFFVALLGLLLCRVRYWFTTGVTRAVRKGFASVQENWRDDGVIPFTNVMNDIKSAVIPQVLVFRSLMESVAHAELGIARLANTDSSHRPINAFSNFTAVVQYLSDIQLAAPFYVIIAGAGSDGDGVVIARGTQKPAGPLLRLSDANGTSPASFFIAQTNYDHWEPDEASDPRRTVHLDVSFGVAK